MKRITKDILIFCVVFLAAVILVSRSFTGNVVWTDVHLNNCSDTQIQTYWDSIFTRSFSSDVIIEKNNQVDGYCDSFIAYNYTADPGMLNGSLYVLYSGIWNDTWNDTKIYTSPDGTYRILENITTKALYLNVSQEFMDNFYTLGFDEKISALYSVAPGNITNWSLTTNDSVNIELTKYFQANIFSDINWSKPANWEFTNTSSSLGKNSSSNDYSVFENKSAIFITHVMTRYDPDYYLEYSGTIPSFRNDTNTSLIYAFNWTDYFNVSSDVNLTINFSADSNNTAGEYINATIGDNGNVSFNANENFTGRRQFAVLAVSPAGINSRNISSNIFNVTFNTLPKQIKDIEDIYLIDGYTSSIDLNDYFHDSDVNQVLNYSIYGSFSGIDVDINGSDLDITLKSNFDGIESLRIKVSDGIDSIKSNSFDIHEENVSKKAADTPAPADNSSNNETPDKDSNNNNSSSENNNGSKTVLSSNNIKPISEATDPKKALRIVLWSFLSVICLAIIVIIVMIFLKSKNKNSYSKKNTTMTQSRPATRSRNARPPLRQIMPNRGPRPNYYRGRR